MKQFVRVPPPLMNDNAQTIHKVIAVIKEFRDAIHKAIGKCCKAFAIPPAPDLATSLPVALSI
jgi:hypothetical protein